MNIISASSSLSLSISPSRLQENGSGWSECCACPIPSKANIFLASVKIPKQFKWCMYRIRISRKNVVEFLLGSAFSSLSLFRTFPIVHSVLVEKLDTSLTYLCVYFWYARKKNSEHNAKCRCFAISVFSLLPWLIHNLLLWCFFIFARESHTPNATRMRSLKLRNNHFRLLNANNGENRAWKIQTNNIRKHVCICFRECI